MRRLFVLAAFLLAFLLTSPAAQALDAATYAPEPVASGDYKTYLEGSALSTSEILILNSSDWLLYDDQSSLRLRLDGAGYSEVGVTFFDVFLEEFGVVDITYDYDTPLIILPDTFELGEEWSTTTGFDVSVPGYSWRRTFEKTVSAIRIESVTVPFGTFPDAVVLEERRRQWSSVGELFSDNLSRKWRVPCLGNVRAELTDLLTGDGPTVVLELADTNLVYCPEPSERALGLASFITLAVLTAGRRRSLADRQLPK